MTRTLDRTALPSVLRVGLPAVGSSSSSSSGTGNR